MFYCVKKVSVGILKHSRQSEKSVVCKRIWHSRFHWYYLGPEAPPRTDILRSCLQCFKLVFVWCYQKQKSTVGPLPPFAFLICFLPKYHREIFKPFVVGLTGWFSVPLMESPYGKVGFKSDEHYFSIPLSVLCC